MRLATSLRLRKLREDGKLGPAKLYSSYKICDNVLKRSTGYTSKHVISNNYILSSGNKPVRWYLISQIGDEDTTNIDEIARAFYESGVINRPSGRFYPEEVQKIIERDKRQRQSPNLRARRIKTVRRLLVKINSKYDNLVDAANHHDKNYELLCKEVRG